MAFKVGNTVVIPPWRDMLPYTKVKAGDWNGFSQLFFDNVGTMLGLIGSLELVLTGFYDSTLMTYASAPELEPFFDTVREIIYKRIIPGFGFSCFCGGLFYALQCIRVSTLRGEQATAMPYGINTPGSFAVLFSVISGTVIQYSSGCSALVTTGTSEELTQFAACWENAADQGWRAGIVTNFVVGLISVALSAFARWLLKVTPPPALLTSLSGIAIAYLGLTQLANTYAEPITGFLPLFLIFFLYFGDVDVPYVPKAVIVVGVGIIIGWADSVLTPDDVKTAVDSVEWYGMETGFRALGDWTSVKDYIGTVFPVAIAAAAGTLMNVYSAKLAGDTYNVEVTMISDGIGTIIAAFFGCPFSTSVYIGHPAYKLMGAGSFYSSFTGFVLLLLSVSGLFALIDAIVPLQAVAPIIFFVGMMICAEAVSSAAPRQVPAIFFGLFFSISDWTTQNGFAYGTTTQFFGYVGMAKGTLLNALISTSLAIFIIDRNYIPAFIWCIIAAFLSAFGIIHQVGAEVQDWTAPQGSSDQGGYCQIDPVDGVCTDRSLACLVDMCGAEGTTKWRFMTAYLMVGVVCLGFYALQRFGAVGPTLATAEEEEELAEKGARDLMHMASENPRKGSVSQSAKALGNDDSTHSSASSQEKIDDNDPSIEPHQTEEEAQDAKTESKEEHTLSQV
ncbi:Hypothetical Protein FCC1311_088302 [Hondaea fermentalgiana]|uniref:Uncharacterized protein n=1 Tax=Hondaea fermentalgiana TaxID=2315210 RepID=A0A2R5GPR0_9STRA|nr:Hypothetical Protein FCC1311_088302 [Hondaea fermentalgiana]|eukprot:GBG32605.1 Hypothetical Protein FCC1311_088302 [Hondaea fermentalgiana]